MILKNTFLSLSFLFLSSTTAFSQFDDTHVVKSNFIKANAGDKLMTLLSYDVNNDGNMDVLIDGGMYQAQSNQALECSNVIVLHGNGIGGFVHGGYMPKAGSLHFIADIKDYNNDSFGDLIMYSFWDSGIKVYNGTAQGTFPSFSSYSTSTHGNYTKFYDIDNDGDLDIVSINSGSIALVGLHIYRNNQGIFTHESYYNLNNFGGFVTDFKIADFNGDGRKDIVVAEPTLYMFFVQKPDKTFEYSSSSASSDSGFKNNGLYTSRAYTDVNLDGKDDLILSRRFPSKLIANYSNGNSQNCFDFNKDNETITLSSDDFGYALNGREYQADLDHDNAMDFVYTSVYGNSRYIFVNYDPFNIMGHRKTEKLSFATSTSAIAYNAGLNIADFNKDGYEDIAIVTNDNFITVFLNQLGTVSTSNITESFFIKTYPNPSEGIVHFEYNSSEAGLGLDVSIYNLGGKLIKYWHENSSKWDLNTKDFASGVYTFRFTNANGAIVVKKMIFK